MQASEGSHKDALNNLESVLFNRLVRNGRSEPKLCYGSQRVLHGPWRPELISRPFHVLLRWVTTPKGAIHPVGNVFLFCFFNFKKSNVNIFYLPGTVLGPS